MTLLENSFGQHPPSWIARFDRDPLDAVDRLLMQRVVSDRPGGAGGAELLRDWLVVLRDDEDFESHVDAALSEWIASRWQRTPARRAEAKRLARAWLTAFDLVSFFDFFESSAEQLLKRVDEREGYLWPLSSGPSRDPVGRFLLAIADYQEDRSLARMWWNLCDVPPDVPYYHSQYVLAGIRGLPAYGADRSGGLRQDVVQAVIRCATALSRAVDEGRVSERTAAEEFKNVAAITIAAFPFPQRWERTLRGQTDDVPERVRTWLGRVSPAPTKPRRRARRAVAPRAEGEVAAVMPRSTWAASAVEARHLLTQRNRRGRSLADTLLTEQRSYAEQTGDASGLARSLCGFASAIWDYEASTASGWANEARLWAPWDPYTWNTLTRALMLDNKSEKSISVGWQTIERFPDNEVAWNDLGAALDKANRFLEAEEVYWQSIERFPDRPYGWRGLGDVLRNQGEFRRAEDIYKRALEERFADNAFIHDGLANVLKAVGRYDESVAHYKRAIELNPRSAYSWRGLAMAEKAAGRLDDAQEAFEGGVRHAEGDELLARGLRALQQQRARLAGAARTDPEEPIAEVETAASPTSLTAAQLVEAPEERESQLSAARTLRRAARRRFENAYDGEVPRGHAAAILQALQMTRPWEARPYAEAMLGAVEADDVGKAKELLGHAADRFPEAPQLAYAETRVRRAVKSLEGDNYSADITDEVVAPMRRLRRIDQSVRTVELLETLSAQFLAEQNGHEGPSRTIERIRRVVDSRNGTGDAFSSWWKARVREYVFGAAPAMPDVEAVRERIGAHRRELDALEEDLTNRMTVLTP